LASRRKSSVEIYTSKEKQFKIILTQHIGKSLRILYRVREREREREVGGWKVSRQAYLRFS
jgi:hypothetical protein